MKILKKVLYVIFLSLFISEILYLGLIFKSKNDSLDTGLINKQFDNTYLVYNDKKDKTVDGATGFLIEGYKNVLFTNKHAVVDNESVGFCNRYNQCFNFKNNEYKIVTDDNHDLAAIIFNKNMFAHRKGLPLCNDSKVFIGHRIQSVGNPSLIPFVYEESRTFDLFFKNIGMLKYFKIGTKGGSSGSAIISSSKKCILAVNAKGNELNIGSGVKVEDLKNFINNKVK